MPLNTNTTEEKNIVADTDTATSQNTAPPTGQQQASDTTAPQTSRAMSPVIFWGGIIGAIILIALLVFVYLLVIGEKEDSATAPLTRTEAAIRGEEPNLIQPASETAEELERILQRLEAAAALGLDPDDPALEGHSLDAPGEHDPFLPATLVRRMAIWMVDQYYPKGTHPRAASQGVLTVGISAADSFAASLFTQPGDIETVGILPYHRALDYAFTADMLEALYLMHVQTFSNAFSRAMDVALREQNSVQRPLAPQERAECVKLYAATLTQLADALNVYMELPERSRRLSAWLSARERRETASARLIDARAQHSRLQSRQSDTTESRQLLQLAERAEEQAVMAEARTRENLLEALRANPMATGIDSGTLLYVATWAERRIVARRENSASIPVAADILTRLAGALLSLAPEGTQPQGSSD